MLLILQKLNASIENDYKELDLHLNHKKIIYFYKNITKINYSDIIPVLNMLSFTIPSHYEEYYNILLTARDMLIDYLLIKHRVAHDIIYIYKNVNSYSVTFLCAEVEHIITKCTYLPIIAKLKYRVNNYTLPLSKSDLYFCNLSLSKLFNKYTVFENIGNSIKHIKLLLEFIKEVIIGNIIEIIIAINNIFMEYLNNFTETEIIKDLLTLRNLYKNTMHYYYISNIIYINIKTTNHVHSKLIVDKATKEKNTEYINTIVKIFANVGKIRTEYNMNIEKMTKYILSNIKKM